MGFSWNGIHTSELGILAEAKVLPILPAPKIVTEEIAGRDGFYDFSTFTANNRVHYSPREWEYRCSFDSTLINVNDIGARVGTITKLFSSYSGYLIEDKCKNVRWKGVITNNFSLTEVARSLRIFGVFIKTQSFGEGLDEISVTHNVSGSDTLTIVNTGTWYVMPDIYLTGQSVNAKIGEYKVHFDGSLSRQLTDGPELTPGENRISISGFTGKIEFVFRPMYLRGDL